MKKDKQVFGTTEWATKNANFISGCVHNCKYCYSKEMAIRFKRKTVENWIVEEINHNSLNKKHKKVDGYIMFPSSHDISPENIEYSLLFLGNLLKSDNDVLIVTKPHLSVIQKICETFADNKDKILFRFTIGANSTEVLKFWEPGAPTFEERLESLKHAYKSGFKTSISCEPVLDPNVSELIDILHPYVSDSIWVGKPNFLLKRLKVNRAYDEESINRAKELDASLSDSWANNLYNLYKDNPQVKWKESIKKVLNIKIQTKKGLDI